MMPHRLTPLCVWLAAILLVVATMLAPAAASAHPGHGEAHLHGGLMVSDPPQGPGASPGIPDDLANAALLVDTPHATHRVSIAAEPEVERACTGSACCGTGHGCCAAVLADGHAPTPPPTASRLAIARANAPPGRDAPRLPEPPRPIR